MCDCGGDAGVAATKDMQTERIMPVDSKQTIPVGIPGDHLEQQERQLPENEPPPLAINEKLSVVGKSTPRLDGKLKVTGAAKYTADVKLPGMLYAQMITAAYP